MAPEIGSLCRSRDSSRGGDNLVVDSHERVDHPRIELLSTLTADLGDRLVERPRFLVRTFVCQRIEDIGYGRDPAVERDLIARESSVSSTVPAFVLRPCDLLGHR
jgi:hypothetical protein